MGERGAPSWFSKSELPGKMGLISTGSGRGRLVILVVGILVGWLWFGVVVGCRGGAGDIVGELEG